MQPFADLVIDPSTWGAAHDYHRTHNRLHLLSMHGSGIASGLTVVPTHPPSDAVLVEPGVAIAAAGEVILVAERERIAIDARGGAVYLAIQHIEAAPVREDGSPRRRPAGGPWPRRRGVPRRGADRAPADAGDRARPRRHRGQRRARRHRRAQPVGGGQVPLEVRVALVAGPGAEPGADHVRGFSHLLRACAFAGVRATPVFAANGEVPEADLLYVTGHADAKPSSGLVDGLRERLVGGSWLFADGCGAGETFVDGLQPLLDAAPGSPSDQIEALVARARYVFGAPPPGACEGELRWGSRAVLSSRDYGCAWQGRSSGDPLPRGQIRDALEFGVNVAVCAGG